MKILIADALSARAVDIFKENGFTVDVKTGMNEEELVSVISEYDAMVVRSATKATAKVIESAEKLKVIGRAGSGVDNIDQKAATRKGIAVMNTPGANTVSTAEHTFAMLLALSRNIPQAFSSIRDGRWDRKKYQGAEVRGKTIGIVGLGNIGKAVAQRAIGFNMKVLGFDPFLSEEAAAREKIELISIDELFKRSDYISFHTPLNKDTKHLINSDSLKKCKKGVRILNCARGGIVDEEALVAAIESGQVAGAALDVFENEPPENNSPLVNNDKIIFTPHLGASTKEAQEIVAELVAEQIVDALKGKGFRNAVNMPALDQKEIEGLRSFLTLAENLGSLQYQLAEGQMKELYVDYQGDFEGMKTGAITTAVVKGLLCRASSDTVNDINAMTLAAERGLNVNETFTSLTGDYTHLISVTYVTSTGKHRVKGTVFGKNDVRIVSVDNYVLNAAIEEYALLYTNEDHPGMIAKVSAVLADNKINVASMFLARESKGGTAMVLINTDSPVQEEPLKTLSGIPGVQSVKSIEFS